MFVGVIFKPTKRGSPKNDALDCTRVRPAMFVQITNWTIGKTVTDKRTYHLPIVLRILSQPTWWTPKTHPGQVWFGGFVVRGGFPFSLEPRLSSPNHQFRDTPQNNRCPTQTNPQVSVKGSSNPSPPPPPPPPPPFVRGAVQGPAQGHLRGVELLQGDRHPANAAWRFGSVWVGVSRLSRCLCVSGCALCYSPLVACFLKGYLEPRTSNRKHEVFDPSANYKSKHGHGPKMTCFLFPVAWTLQRTAMKGCNAMARNEGRTLPFASPGSGKKPQDTHHPLPGSDKLPK